MSYTDVKDRFVVSQFPDANVVHNELRFAYENSPSFAEDVDQWLNDNPSMDIQVNYVPGAAEAIRANGIVNIDPNYTNNAYYISTEGNSVKASFLMVLVHEVSHIVNNVRDNVSISDLRGDNVRHANIYHDEMGTPERVGYNAFDTVGFLNYERSFTNGELIENAIFGKTAHSIGGMTVDTTNVNLKSLGVLGNTLYIGSSGSDNVHGTDSRDIFHGSGGSDIFYGEGGNDLFVMDQSGIMSLDGGSGSDAISYEEFESGVDIDVFDGIFQNASGVIDIEKVIGTDFVDNMRGASGYVLDGGEGNDIFTMDNSGFALGGDDNDTFLISGFSDTLPTIYGGEGYDKIEITSTAFESYNMSTGQFFNYDGSMSVIQGIEEVTFKWGTVYGTNGTDHIINTMMGVAYGRDGDDFMTGNSEGIHGGVEGLFGEAGKDHLVSLGWDNLYGGADDDILVGNYKTMLMDGGSGNDVIHSSTQDGYLVEIMPGRGNDTIYGDGSLNSQVRYNFTMDHDPGLSGDSNSLISVFDMGNYFQVNTTIGTDKVFNIPGVYFKDNDYNWELFEFYEGMAWINPDGPFSNQSMNSESSFEEVSLNAFEGSASDINDHGMLEWRLPFIQEIDYHLV